MLPFLLTMLFMDVLVNSQISPPNPSNPSPISLLSLEQSISNIQQQQSHAYQSFEMRKGIAVATYNHFRALDSTKQLPLLVLFSETQDSRPTSLEECKSQCRLNESCFAFTYYDHTVYDEASGYLPFLGESVSSSYFDESNHLNNDFWCKLYPKNKFPLSEKELLATVQDDCCQTGVLIRTEPSPPSSLPPPPPSLNDKKSIVFSPEMVPTSTGQGPSRTITLSPSHLSLLSKTQKTSENITHVGLGESYSVSVFLWYWASNHLVSSSNTRSQLHYPIIQTEITPEMITSGANENLFQHNGTKRKQKTLTGKQKIFDVNAVGPQISLLASTSVSPQLLRPIFSIGSKSYPLNDFFNNKPIPNHSHKLNRKKWHQLTMTVSTKLETPWVSTVTGYVNGVEHVTFEHLWEGNLNKSNKVINGNVNNKDANKNNFYPKSPSGGEEEANFGTISFGSGVSGKALSHHHVQNGISVNTTTDTFPGFLKLGRCWNRALSPEDVMENFLHDEKLLGATFDSNFVNVVEANSTELARTGSEVVRVRTLVELEVSKVKVLETAEGLEEEKWKDAYEIGSNGKMSEKKKERPNPSLQLVTSRKSSLQRKEEYLLAVKNFNVSLTEASNTVNSLRGNGLGYLRAGPLVRQYYSNDEQILSLGVVDWESDGVFNYTAQALLADNFLYFSLLLQADIDKSISAVGYLEQPYTIRNNNPELGREAYYGVLQALGWSRSNDNHRLPLFIESEVQVSEQSEVRGGYT